MITNRRALDRAGVAAFTGKSDKTVQHWYSNRDETGFPEVCDTDAAGRQWFWQTEITAFWNRHQTAKASALTTVDRTGDPGELVTAPQAATILGYRHRDNLPPAIIEHPDETEELPSGRQRRRWRRSTLWAYADGRVADPQAGRPAGTGTGNRKPYRYADDERLTAAIALLQAATTRERTARGLGAVLAQELNIDDRTAQRLMTAAKKAALG
jgi:hypothetical protein